MDRVNGAGRYQLVTFWIFNFLWFLTSWMLLGLGFFFDDDLTCRNIHNKEDCLRHVCAFPAEARWEQIETHPSSIVFAFEGKFMICEDYSYQITVLQSMLYFGSLTGFFLIPYIADNSGRRLAMRISWFLCTLGVLVVALADSSNMVGLGLFLAGFGSNPAITLCYSFIN